MIVKLDDAIPEISEFALSLGWAGNSPFFLSLAEMSQFMSKYSKYLYGSIWPVMLRASASGQEIHW